MTEAKNSRPVVPGRRQEPLPEKGHARNEELKKRYDDLMQLKAEIEGQLERDGVVDFGGKPPINVADMKIENEIASQFDLLTVPNAQSEFAYAWANYVNQHGLAVTMKQVDGWEIVCGDMPECASRKDELGRRRIGDVILMRIPLDRYVQIQFRNQVNRENQRQSVNNSFQEIGERYGHLGIRTRTTLNDNEAKRALAKQIAGQKVDSMIRSGSMPGLRVGR